MVRTFVTQSRIASLIASLSVREPELTPRLYNALIGTRFKIVTGYPGGNQINLAMERNEVEARNNTWSSWKTTHPDWLKDGTIKVIAWAGPKPQDMPDQKHLRIRIRFDDALGTELRFVDQRTFGGLSLHETTPEGLPDVIAHIARDPLDPAFDDAAFAAALRLRRTTVKRALLDQSLISGIGNIYADEALWRAALHYERPTATLTRPHRPAS